MGLVNVKKWFQSKTIQGAIASAVGVAVFAAKMAGYDVGDPAEWTALILAIGGNIGAIYGRVKAVEKIG